MVTGALWAGRRQLSDSPMQEQANWESEGNAESFLKTGAAGGKWDSSTCSFLPGLSQRQPLVSG